MSILGPVSVCALAGLALALGFAIYKLRTRHPPRRLRRTQTLAYTYSATATVQREGATYLNFPAPPLTCADTRARPTVLKDFADDVGSFRAQ